MEGTLKIKDPEKLEATLQITCTLEQFKKLDDALSKSEANCSAPIWELRELIRKLINKAEQVFYEKAEGITHG